MNRIFLGIPILNRFDLLEKAIESFDYAPIELFVVDNNTVCEKNKEAFRKLKDKFMFDSFSPRYNLGVAASWNRIITTAWSRGYGFVYIGSNDITLGPGTLQALVELEKPEPECLWMVNDFNFWCLRLSAVPKIGLPDENFMPAYFEDSDYSRRIKLAGFDYICMGDKPFVKNGRSVPAVSSHHLGSQTIRSDQEYAIHNGNTFNNWNRNHYIMKWGGAPDSEQFSTPYGDPSRPITWWPDPAGSVAVRDWDNGKREKIRKCTIDEKLEQAKHTRSDINEHLVTLKRYAETCDHVTEMGVRWVTSTWAFLAARPKRLVSYDISDCNIDEALKMGKEIGVNFDFRKLDVLKVEIEPTDLLFIDTYHAYPQLTMELTLHSPRTRKYIIMHDTTTYAYRDEGRYQGVSVLASSGNGKAGLRPAIQDFLATPEGSNWLIREVFENNNGLTVLERINEGALHN